MRKNQKIVTGIEYCKLNKEELRAYHCWINQMYRCYKPKNRGFQWYGAKGVEVKYSCKEFILWWVDNIKNFKGSRPTISRIDHKGHYSFDNIIIEDHFKNCIDDVQTRNGRFSGAPVRKIMVVDSVTMNPVAQFGSTRCAGKYFGVTHGTIARWAQNGTLAKDRYILRYGVL